MRPWLRKLIVLLLLAGIFVAAWLYANREQLARQWHCYKVGAAGSFDQAQGEIAWFETGPDRHARLAELTQKWGTGNGQFDLHLARYLHAAACSDRLRESFSKELGRRRELLPRWAHYWSYRAKLEPDGEIASILKYLDGRVSAEPPKTITWREVLNLQAVLQLTGQGQLAPGFSPASWQVPYRRWQQTRPAQIPHVARPEVPFADWQGPVAD